MQQNIECRYYEPERVSFNKNFEVPLVPLHLHSMCELVYLNKGKLTVLYNFNKYEFKQGDLFLAFPNTAHGYVLEYGESTEKLVAEFDARVYSEFTSVFKEKMIEGSPIINLNNFPDAVGFSIEELKKETKGFGMDDIKTTLSRSYIGIIVHYLLKGYKLVESEDGDEDIIISTMNYLNKNFQKDISLEKLSKKIGVNKFYISKNFNSRISCTIPHYLNLLRSQKAIELLTTTDMDIIDVAYESGFSSLTTFFRAFRDLGLSTPKKYRNRKEL
ncbi:MAG: AraC family transcriptional regulator [Clostridia bacterium]